MVHKDLRRARAAAINIIPSIAMLTTPDRSQMIPASAPNVIGVASRMTRANTSTISTLPPATAHSKIVKKANAIMVLTYAATKRNGWRIAR